jgi:Zn-dependent protease
MFGDPVVFLIATILLIPAILVAIPVHELGHGVAAFLMGDPSPRNRGYFRPGRRLFNVYGVIAAILVNVGFGTPIPINEYRLNGASRKLVYVLGGPAANLLVAAVVGIVVRVLETQGYFHNFTTFSQPVTGIVATVLYAIFFLNLSTFAFQLLPFPGLDGWRIVETLFRNRNPKFFFNVAANLQTIWIVAFFAVVFLPFFLHFSVLNLVTAIFFHPASVAILGRCDIYVQLQPCLP